MPTSPLAARLAESVDAPDLKSVSPRGECRFESGSGHQRHLRRRRGRRVAAAALGGLLATAGLPAVAATAPYPASTYVTGMTLDWSTYRRAAQGSDNWPTTWASDGRLYATWGDGGGWGEAARGVHVSLGVGRLTGDTARSITGVNLVGGYRPQALACFPPLGGLVEKKARTTSGVSPCVKKGLHGKSRSILALNSGLYLFVSPGSTYQGYSEGRIYKSSLTAKSWTRAAWAFRNTDNVPLLSPNFVQAGQNNGDSEFVYAYSTRYAPFKDYGLHRGPDGAGEIHLLRAAKGANLMERGAWQFYAGSGPDGAPVWSGSQAQSKAVFRDPASVGWNNSGVYVKALGRYLLITQHEDRAAGKLGIFEAPNAWGPWSTVWYGTLSNAARGVPATSFFAAFVANSFKEGGTRFTFTFTGTDSIDSFNAVDGRFTVNAARRRGG